MLDKEHSSLVIKIVAALVGLGFVGSMVVGVLPSFLSSDSNQGPQVDNTAEFAKRAVELDKALKESPDQPNILYEQGTVYYQWATALEQSKKPTEATEKYEKASANLKKSHELQPNADLLSLLGNVSFDCAHVLKTLIKKPESVAKFQEAIDYYQQYLVINPSNSDVRVDMGIAYFEKGDAESAISHFNQVIEANPQHVKVWFNLGFVLSQSGKKEDAIKAWKKLLSANQGNQLHFDVFTQSADGKWTRFKRISNTISHEQIDSYVAYRLITSIYGIWSNRGIGLYQRNLENFQEKRFVWNKTFDGGCVNCHTFYKNSPDKMLFHLRSKEHGKGSVVHSDGKTYKLNTGTDFNGAAIYMDFSPTGKSIVFSANNIIQFFHTTGEQRDVYDLTSDLAIYSFETNTVTSTPQISDPNRQETYPTWSPDGKYLYFCSGPQLPVARFKEVKYGLMRGCWATVDALSIFGVRSVRTLIAIDADAIIAIAARMPVILRLVSFIWKPP